MSKQFSFSSEDAEHLLQELQKLQEILEQEWSQVLNQWSNLKATWQDDQFDRFEPLFEELVNSYKSALFEAEVYTGFLNKQIEHAQKPGLNLEILEKPLAFSGMAASLLGMATNPPTNNPTTLNPSQNFSYIQQKEPDSCSVEDKIKPEELPAVKKYQLLPGIARIMDNQELPREAYIKEEEDKIQSRKQKAEIGEIASNKPLASGSPDPDVV